MAPENETTGEHQWRVRRDRVFRRLANVNIYSETVLLDMITRRTADQRLLPGTGKAEDEKTDHAKIEIIFRACGIASPAHQSKERSRQHIVYPTQMPVESRSDFNPLVARGSLESLLFRVIQSFRYQVIYDSTPQTTHF